MISKIKSIGHAYRSFDEISISLRIFLLALIPSAITLMLLEMFMDRTDLIKVQRVNSNSFDFDSIIYYQTINAAHIILCVITLRFFFKYLSKSGKKTKSIWFYVFIAEVVINGLLILVDSLGFNISVLSHERVYSVLSKSNDFHIFFVKFPGIWLNNDLNLFHPFSLLPYSMLLLGFSVIVFGSFYAGKKVARFKPSKTDDIKDVLDSIIRIKEQLRVYLGSLSIILVTSALSTLVFLQLPVSLLTSKMQQTAFKQTSFTVSVTWGVVFSLTLLVMYMVPYALIKKKIDKVILRETFRESNKYQKWLESNNDVFLVSNDLRISLTILAPFIISLIGPVLSKM